MSEKNNYQLLSLIDERKQTNQFDVDVNNRMEFNDNYILENQFARMNNDSNTRNNTIEEPKLFQQLISKDRQKSLFYNVIVLAFFNINIAHFCFSYLADKIGIIFIFLILILTGFYSYWIQGMLIRHISHNKESDNLSYAKIVENNFSYLSGTILEVSIFIWYSLLLTIFIMTSKI